MRNGLYISQFRCVEFHDDATVFQAPLLSGRSDPTRGLVQLRFTLSLRDVEEMSAQRGIDMSYETIRCWIIKFGPQIAANP